VELSTLNGLGFSLTHLLHIQDLNRVRRPTLLDHVSCCIGSLLVVSEGAVYAVDEDMVALVVFQNSTFHKG
jgi:hypothetical protein